ncbi:odorant receptor 29, partial [Diachasma alloeum]
METTTQFTTIWNDNIAYAFGLYRLITQSLGIWPFTCHKFISKCQVLIVCVLQLTMMISIIGEMHLQCGEVSDKIQNISLCSCAFMTIVKVTIIRAHNPRMHEIMMSAMQDWLCVKTADDNKKMRSCAKLGRSICLFQMIGAYVTAIPIILSGFAGHSAVNTTNSTDSDIKILPLGTVCLFQQMSSSFYTSVYIIQCIQLLITCTGNVGCDCYFFGVTMHLSGQIEKLTDDMERFGKEKEDTDCHEKLVALVKRQNHLLELAENLETTFNIVILVELSALTYEICLIALQMVVNLRMGNSVVIINNIIMLQILYLQLFLYSYAGERLSSGLENLGSAIYSSEWCDSPSKVTKDLIFVMMRCRKSFALTAGKVCVMNLESFTNIIKAVGSYFSVLLAMFD